MKNYKMAVVLRTLLIFISILSPVISTPLYTSSFSNSGNARNIRHLPCVSLRTGKTGVCMFALDCVKANGTHLGTCLDRFYFGSCCKINSETYIHPQDNTIEESSSFLTTIKPIESNDIPDIIKINNSKLEKPIFTTKKPITIETITTRTTTTTPTSIGLSTFQTISDDSSSTSFASSSPTTDSRPLTTQKPLTTSEIQRKPITTTQFVKPTSPSLPSTTERITPATRFPPRNATTTTTAVPTSVTIMTSTSDSLITSTRKPTTTTTTTTGTKKPVSSANTRRPTRPSSTTLLTTKPIFTTTQKPLDELATIVTSTTTSAPTKQTSSTNSATLSISSQKPSTTLTTTSKPRPSSTEIPRPSTSSTKPRPSKPTKSPSSTSSKPTKISGKPSTTISQKPAGKPRPSNKPTKYPKPPKPVTPITSTTFEITTATPTTTSPTTLPPSTTTIKTTTTTTTTTTTAGTTAESTQATSTTVNITSTTLGNDIPPIKLATTENLGSSVETSTQSFVTWSSNSDELVTSTTAPPTTSMSSTIQEHEETTETEWSPITTPDGWIMIQNLSTKQPDNDNDTTTTEIPTTQSPSTSVEILSPTTESVPTEKVPTLIPTTNRPASTSPAFDHLNMSDYKQVCGRRLFPESRIVGGARSSFGKWPWQISLRQWRNSVHLHKCGAALLNENWAITAAHCVENVPPSELLLRIGEYDLANEDEPYGFQERRVQMVASHPSFDPRTFEYDLALLRFYEPLAPFQPNYLPICVPDDDEGYVGQTAYVTGWGRLYEDGPLPSVLQEVSVPIINNSDCEGMYRAAGYIEHIPKIFICAGWKKGGFDSCEGDSGGPLVIRRPRDNRWILAGVISWGIGCAMPFQPGVYTRISEFKEWINQILQF